MFNLMQMHERAVLAVLVVELACCLHTKGATDVGGGSVAVVCPVIQPSDTAAQEVLGAQLLLSLFATGTRAAR